MDWEIVIGLETHAQLSTRSKIFSGAATAFGAPPNTQACAVDVALPGVLPVLNVGAVERAIRFGIAVGATINRPWAMVRAFTMCVTKAWFQDRGTGSNLGNCGSI